MRFFGYMCMTDKAPLDTRCWRGQAGMNTVFDFGTMRYSADKETDARAILTESLERWLRDPEIIVADVRPEPWLN